MSKLNQIQNELKEIGQGEFQKLADSYLHKKGYEKINSIGSVLGMNKTKTGTPDSLISLPNGKYVFAEHTTEQSKLYKKFSDDLDNCFTENKTGIPIKKIEEVLLCHNSTLSPEEEMELLKKCENVGVKLDIFGINQISFDLYQKYPDIALEHLRVTIDTRQILSIDDFIGTYNKNKLASRLDTKLQYREKNINDVLKFLNDNNVIIVSGKPGVGKTRFALECCNLFKEGNSKYNIKCIFNRGVDIFNDINSYFSDSGEFLILLDDANRLSQFDYLIQFILDQRSDQHIKIIITVRDYALEKVKETVKCIDGLKEFKLLPLEGQEIEQIVKEEYSITHPFTLERITDVSKGNPRLAIMLSEVLKQNGNIELINTVSNIYDEYFNSVINDIDLVNNENLLKVSGISSFLKVVDISSKEMMQMIESVFGIISNEFWSSAKKLHDLEIFDMYENEVVKVSDQVLSSYLFYLCFIKKHVLDFSVLLNSLFPQYKKRLIDSINPILNDFDYEFLMDFMRPHVEQLWNKLETNKNHDDLLELIRVFWFLKQTDTLVYIKKLIDEIEPKPIDLSVLKIKDNQYVKSSSTLEILALFKGTEDITFRISLNLMFSYLSKRSDEFSNVKKILLDNFCFTRNSYLNGYSVQRTVVEVLYEYAKNNSEFFGNLFLSVTENYLETQFFDIKSDKNHSGQFIRFELSTDNKLMELRDSIWSKVLDLFNFIDIQDNVLDFLFEYSKSENGGNIDLILKNESKKIIDFIETSLNENNCYHCLIVDSYLTFLKSKNISFSNNLQNRFNNKTFKSFKILSTGFIDDCFLEMSFDEFFEYKKKKIISYFSAFCFNDYKEFITEINIYTELNKKQNEGGFRNGFLEILNALAGRDQNLYKEVLIYY